MLFDKNGKRVNVHTQRLHHQDVDELQAVKPKLFAQFNLEISMGLGVYRHVGKKKFVSCKTGKETLSGFHRTQDLHTWCAIRNRFDPKTGEARKGRRVITPAVIYGVMLSRLVDLRPESWQTSAVPNRNGGYKIRTYELMVPVTV